MCFVHGMIAVLIPSMAVLAYLVWAMPTEEP